MKFITEDDLREQYRKAPFTEYVLEQGTRMTPGARQFLLDKGVRMQDQDGENIRKKTGTDTVAMSAPKQKTDLRSKKLFCSVRSMEALFFQTEQELLGRDLCLTQSVMELGKQFSCIKKAIQNHTETENLCFQECSGINSGNCFTDLGDCFEITQFHVQLDKGREIILLHRLRCALQETALVIEELYAGEDGRCEEIASKVYQIINRLSQLICAVYGGEKCLRQT